MSSLMTCACLDRSIKKSASTAHKLSECPTFYCTCNCFCASSLPAIDDGFVKLMFTGSPQRFFEENHSFPSLPTDRNSPEANMDIHQCKRVFYLKVTLILLVMIAEIILICTCSPFVQVLSLTG